jgi:hypothetical protein
MRNCFLVLGLLIPLLTSAQSESLGSWNLLNLKYSIDNRWSLFGEAQLRSLRWYDDFHYYEYKGGFNYKVLPQVVLSLGAGSYQTYGVDGDFVLPKNNDEFRLWPQLVISQSIGHVKIEQRYRSELRFTSNGYRNRFRYRVGLNYPFGNKKQGVQPFQLSASNELFFTNKEPYFERNRLLLAVQYRLSPQLSLQTGYLYQFDYRINDETGKRFALIGMYIDLN